MRNGGTGVTELPRGGSGSGVIIDAISIRIVRDGLTLQVPLVVAENPRGNGRQ